MTPLDTPTLGRVLGSASLAVLSADRERAEQRRRGATTEPFAVLDKLRGRQLSWPPNWSQSRAEVVQNGTSPLAFVVRMPIWSAGVATDVVMTIEINRLPDDTFVHQLVRVDSIPGFTPACSVATEADLFALDRYIAEITELSRSADAVINERLRAEPPLELSEDLDRALRAALTDFVAGSYERFDQSAIPGGASITEIAEVAQDFGSATWVLTWQVVPPRTEVYDLMDGSVRVDCPMWTEDGATDVWVALLFAGESLSTVSILNIWMP